MFIDGVNITSKKPEQINSTNGAIHITSPYQDLGLVIDAANMAAGATILSNWYDNVEWVRYLVVLASSDQQFDVKVLRRDTTGVASYESTLQNNVSATGSSWQSLSFSPSTSILGSSAKFALKNSSASVNTFGKLKVQLMGV